MAGVVEERREVEGGEGGSPGELVRGEGDGERR